MTYAFTETLPIAPPATDGDSEEAEAAVGQLAALASEDREARRDALAWLRLEFGVEKPGQKLEDLALLDEGGFIEEVRKRRPKSAGRLTPAALRDLRAGYAEVAAPARERRAEALERRHSDLVNRAYGLTDEEVELLWSTAPPRMPGF